MHQSDATQVSDIIPHASDIEYDGAVDSSPDPDVTELMGVSSSTINVSVCEHAI